MTTLPPIAQQQPTQRPHARKLSRVLLAVALCALSFTQLTGSARAATTNSTSGHAALAAYATYMSRLVSGLPTAATNDQQFIAQLSCQNVISATAQPTSTVELALIEEIEADLQLRQLAVTTGPLTRMAKALNATTWSNGATNITIIARYLSSERALLNVTPSKLCVDAAAIARHPTLVPAATKSFLARFQSATTTAKARLASFSLQILQANEAAGDATLLSQINRLAPKYNRQFNAMTQRYTTTIATQLGLDD